MKACIVSYDEYLNIPYVKDYEAILNEHKIKYDFIFWNRSDLHEFNYKGHNAYNFNWKTKKSKLSKIIPFFLWSRFARGVIKKNSYDFLIICTTVPAILLVDILIKKYRGKYLLDIRDFTYENISIYKYFESKIINASKLTIISSKGFLTWLPKGSKAYVLTHNI